MSNRNRHDSPPRVSPEVPHVLRANETEAEALLWACLRNRHVEGVKFRRQHRFDPYVLDFYCAKAKLAVEVDGSIHNSRKPFDMARDAYFRKQGIETLRVSNADVLADAMAVAARIGEVCKKRIKGLR